MLIYLLNFSNGAGILEDSNWLLLNGKHNTILSLEANGGSTTVDGLECILYLEELSVWSKNSNGFVVGWH